MDLFGLTTAATLYLTCVWRDNSSDFKITNTLTIDGTEVYDNSYGYSYENPVSLPQFAKMVAPIRWI